jgi:hypothetical protein
MWIALFVLLASVFGGNLRSNTTDVMVATNTTQPLAAIKPWYRSAEEKEEAVRRGRGM